MLAPIIVNANCFVSRWFINPAHRDEFTRQFNALYQSDIDALRQATNFVFYGWGRDPNEFVAVESWRDEQALAALRRTPFFQEAVANLMRLCSRDVEMLIYSGMNAPRDWLFAEYPAGPSSVHPRTAESGAVFC